MKKKILAGFFLATLICGFAFAQDSNALEAGTGTITYQAENTDTSAEETSPRWAGSGARCLLPVGSSTSSRVAWPHSPSPSSSSSPAISSSKPGNSRLTSTWESWAGGCSRSSCHTCYGTCSTFSPPSSWACSPTACPSWAWRWKR